MGISKIDVLNKIGHQIDNYYFFISNDGIFNWFDLEGNHIEDSGVLKELRRQYIPDNIVKCIIPDSVTSISENTFFDCKSLKEITIPNSITSIDRFAFYNCTSLTSITIPNNVISIGICAFCYCTSLTSITISDSITGIGEDAFWNCSSLKEITIPNSITYIGSRAFSFCESLKEVIFNGKTLNEVKLMKNYPFGIKDESIIKCEI
jgi:hypothetical protein